MCETPCNLLQQYVVRVCSNPYALYVLPDGCPLTNNNIAEAIDGSLVLSPAISVTKHTEGF